MSTQTELICPRCGGKAMPTIFEEKDYIIKSEPTFFIDPKTGESSIGNTDITYEFQMCICEKCVRMFGLVKKINFRRDDKISTTDGDKVPDTTK